MYMQSERTPVEYELGLAHFRAVIVGNAWRESMSDTTKQYLKTLKKSATPAEAASGLLEAVTGVIMDYNAGAAEGQKWPVPETLYPWQTGELVMKFHKMAYTYRMGYAIYQADGPDKGIYSIYTFTEDVGVRHEAVRDHIISNYIPGTVADREKTAEEACSWLFDFGLHHRRKAYSIKNLGFIAVNNGIFDPAEKVLKPFSPRYAFLEKCRVDYVIGADGPVMRSLDDGTEQDVDVWLAGLPDRTEKFLPRLADSDKEIWFYLR